MISGTANSGRRQEPDLPEAEHRRRERNQDAECSSRSWSMAVDIAGTTSCMLLIVMTDRILPDDIRPGNLNSDLRRWP
jgi:hypothetical protein